MFNVKMLADSVNTVGNRLITMELTYPRFIHSELLTHRMFSRNSASSRAIPVEKMIRNVRENPVIPIHWGANQSGMQADSELSSDDQEFAKLEWLSARDTAIFRAERLLELGLHKQIANRLLEPWMWITVIVSTTSFEHFRRLRCHPAAEPHFQKLAGMMSESYDASTPKLLQDGEWHLPLTGFDGDDSLSLEGLIQVSVARCARVSYLTHDGYRDVSADLGLFERLRSNGHWSPFEHAAEANSQIGRCGNFDGFIQCRKRYQEEFVRDQASCTS